MSYRELRNFSEYMKVLGYHRIVSLENFRTPNFGLVADALYWLCERYDPTAEISDDLNSEKGRVEFLKGIAETMAAKARIKLNIKSLYRGDGFAVRELLKIAKVLHESLRATPNSEEKSISHGSTLQTKLDELKAARNLSNEIVESGSKLFTLLGQENKLKKNREKAIQFVDSISMNLESNAAKETIEKNIREQINSITENVGQLEKMCADLEKDQKSLQAKIERKQTDLERAEKRLRGLKKVPPAFMEEYIRLETELKTVYESYMERFRNLNYLEAELEKFYETERERQKESDRMVRRMQRKMKQEELRILRGEGEDQKKTDDDEDEDEDFDAMRTRKKDRGKVQSTIVGTIDGGSDDDDSSDSAGASRQGPTREHKRNTSAGSGLSGGSEGSQFDDEDEDEDFTEDDELESEGFVDEEEEDDALDNF